MTRRSQVTRPITIVELARMTGVSKSTVSRVIAGDAAVAARTRFAVLETAARVGYRVNPAGRMLRTSRSALVGLLVPAIDHAVFAAIAERLDARLRGQGVALAISSWGGRAADELGALDALLDRGVDALVLALADDRDPGVASRLARIDAPSVLLDREVDGLRVDAVLTCHRPGTRAAVRHLADHGHRRIGLLSVPLVIRPGREATAAYEQGLAEAGLAGDAALRREVVPGGEATGVRALLRAGATAIIVGGATSAVARVLSALRRQRLALPADVSLVAFDDSELARLTTPALTTIARPVARIAALAAELVTTRLAEPDAPPRTESVGTRLVIRGSTGPSSRRQP